MFRSVRTTAIIKVRGADPVIALVMQVCDVDQ